MYKPNKKHPKKKSNRASYGKNQFTGKHRDDPKPTLVCLLLDRSGSMSACKEETVTGFNAYVSALRDRHTPASRFHFVQFDSVSRDTVQDMVPMGEIKDLTHEGYQPRGNTPLNDAVGQTIRSIEVISKRFGFKVLFVIQTDGQENASTEFSNESVKALMKQMENEHKWTFAFIGTGPDGWDQMRSFSAGTQSVGNVMKTTGKNMHRAMRAAGGQSVSYMCSAVSGDAVAKNFYDGKEDQT